jgi:hypothetical protein
MAINADIADAYFVSDGSGNLAAIAIALNSYGYLEIRAKSDDMSALS